MMLQARFIKLTFVGTKTSYYVNSGNILDFYYSPSDAGTKVTLINGSTTTVAETPEDIWNKIYG